MLKRVEIGGFYSCKNIYNRPTYIGQWREMETHDLLARIVSDPQVCGGQPCIRGTRILVSTILDGMAEGLSPEQIIDHYPSLQIDDIRASVAYGAELARENVWKVTPR